MIAIVSSAKTLDFETPWQAKTPTQPEFLDQAKVLAGKLRRLSAKELGRLMSVSDKIAQLNFRRMQDFAFAHTADNSKPSLLAYQGDVFEAMQSASFTADDLAFSQNSLRVLSGLYGILRPKDLIQPYRLEMAIRLNGPNWKDLYEYWKQPVTASLDRDAWQNGGIILNLASQEYAGVLDARQLKSAVLKVRFVQARKGRLEMVPILAKRARGLMAGFMVKSRIKEPEALKGFNAEGYRYSRADSSSSELAFIRRM